MATRREALIHSLRLATLLAAAGLLPQARSAARPQAAFDATDVPGSLKALGVGTMARSGDVKLVGPDVAELGAVVPITFGTTLPGVSRLALLIEKNPNVLAAVFDIGDAIDPAFDMRVKMAQSSNVYAVALMHDGRVLYASREIRVTIGGCGE